MYIVEKNYNATSRFAQPLTVAANYGLAVDIAHEYFLSCGFKVKDGKPYDGDHPTTPFSIFDNVVMHNGKVAGFSHCAGDGPQCRIVENCEYTEMLVEEKKQMLADKNHKCTCKMCTRHQTIKGVIARAKPDELISVIDELENSLVEVEDELSYYSSIFNGSWPEAIELLENRIKELKSKK